MPFKDVFKENAKNIILFFEINPSENPFFFFSHLAFGISCVFVLFTHWVYGFLQENPINKKIFLLIYVQVQLPTTVQQTMRLFWIRPTRRLVGSCGKILELIKWLFYRILIVWIKQERYFLILYTHSSVDTNSQQGRIQR